MRADEVLRVLDDLDDEEVTAWVDGGWGVDVTGWIGGRGVECCNLETQIASHLGYEPDGEDRADMRALAETFGCALPQPYADVNGRP
jgi:hypothetical protein